MVETLKILGVEDIEKIHDTIMFRQTHFPEDLKMSIGVVLLNYGSGFVKVKCINGEWEGTKDELVPRDGVPLCPDGHPLFEMSTGLRLALVEE